MSTAVGSLVWKKKTFGFDGISSQWFLQIEGHLKKINIIGFTFHRSSKEGSVLQMSFSEAYLFAYYYQNFFSVTL